MKTSRHSQGPDTQGPRPASVGLIGAWADFWFRPTDPVGLKALRVLGGLLLLFWLLPFAGQYDSLFGLGGWFDARAYAEVARIPDLPPHLFSWSVLYVCGANPLLVGA